MRVIWTTLRRQVTENLHRLMAMVTVLSLLGAGCASGSDTATAVESSGEPTTVIEPTVPPEPEPEPEPEPTPTPEPTATPEAVEMHDEADDQDEIEPEGDLGSQAGVDDEPLIEETLFDLSLLGAPENLEVPITDDPAPEDTFGEIGGTGIAAPASTIVGSQAFIATMTTEQVDARFNNSSLPCAVSTGDFTVTCARGATQIEDTEFIVVAVAFEGAVADGEGDHRYALAFDDDGDESDNYTSEQFPGDWFTNTEFWYSLHIAADGTRTMWADGVVDQVPGVPRFSAALVIEQGNRLYWIIPRSEVPGADLAYRATGFTEQGVPGDEFNSATSGGDFTGASVLEPLLPIDLMPVTMDNDAAVPPDIDGPQPRLAVPADRAAHIIAILTADFVTRANSALEAGDAESAINLILHPQQRFSPNAETCRQVMRDTIVQANSIELPNLPAGTMPGIPLAAYQPTGALNYPTGSVAWQPILLMGPQGQLYLLLAECL